jgi:formylmethanofuran dehydrogenase subunit A
VNASPNVSVDVGQVMFGQTVTASGDTMAQVRNAKFASPKKWVAMDIECEAGCGVVPFRYRDKNLVNALQWAIGLELFLLIRDPWRVYLTTDHPNGGPVHDLPAPDPAADGQELQERHVRDPAQGRARDVEPWPRSSGSTRSTRSRS